MSEREPEATAQDTRRGPGQPRGQERPADMQRRLDEVGGEIDRAEDQAEELTEHQGRTFTDPGTIGEEQTDDAIVPP
jgi:hypothetical protein